MNKEVRSHKDLVVWQKSIVLVVEIYCFTEKFPREEMFSLVSQMRRAAVSIPSNIAEGRSRGTRKDFTHFLRVGLGSVAELETQLFICQKLHFGDPKQSQGIESELSEVGRMLHAMIKKL